MISNISLPHPAIEAQSRVSTQLAGAESLNKNTTDHGDNPKLREAFDNFVGQTFYGQMLSAMRSTVGKPAYFHGGRGEEVFQAQLDQVLAEKMSAASAAQFTEPMFDLFTMSRR